MKYFVILLVFTISFLVLIYSDTVYGIPEFDPQRAFEYSKYVIVGKILSVEILSTPNSDPSVSNGFALYEIEVEEYLKNTIGNSTIVVPGVYVDSSSSRSYDIPLYKVDQRVLFHIQEEKHALVDYDLIIRDRASGVLLGPLCGPDAYFEKGVCVITDDKTISTYLPCIENRGEECGDIEHFINTEPNPCGEGTTYQDGICIVDQTKNVNSNSSYKWGDPYNATSINETALCGEGTELIDNQCVPIKAVKADSQPSGDDAPFFGIFVYLDNLISWIFG